MPNTNDILVHSLTASHALLRRYAEDLTPQEYLFRATPKANCVAWIIGHLILSDRRVLGLIGATDLPALPDGFEKRFARDETAPGASDFGDVKILMPLFDQHRTRLIAAAKSASPEQLEKPLEKAHPLFKNVWEQVNFMAQHSTMHAGQITMIRRVLGRAPLV
jgi:hypothetical protein